MPEFSKDYHDYVFRDGKLIGEFEAMYAHSEEVPWHQDQQDDWVDVRLKADLLRDFGPFDEIHDLSCGLGHYLALMRGHVGAKGGRGFGYDISETACAKAKTTFPEASFQPLDLTIVPDKPPAVSDQSGATRRLFMIRGTLWYVFPQISRVVQTIRSFMSADDKLLVVQNFPPLDSDFIGKEIIPNPDALLILFAGFFVPIRHVWYVNTHKAGNDNWFIGLFSLGST